MQIKDCKRGDVVTIDNVPRGIATVTVFGLNWAGDMVLVGWHGKGNALPEAHTRDEFIRGQSNARGAAIMTIRAIIQSGCIAGSWVSIRQEVQLASATSTSSSNGMACKGCGNGNNYAQPNQPDGSHKCYSCRSSGR